MRRLGNWSLCLTGLAAMAVGLAHVNSAAGMQPLSQRQIDRITVGQVGGGCNVKCLTPEPDCVDYGCISSGGACVSHDDLTFQEDNSCVGATSIVCTLSDWSVCYVETRCTGWLIPCVSAWPADCDPATGGTCTTTTVNSYDDCTSTDGTVQ
jgi:hypothetical protein